MGQRNTQKIISILLTAMLLMGFEAGAQQLQPQKTKPVVKNIEVGMYVTIGNCVKDKKEFRYLELYTKTRIPDAAIVIDSATGDGIFENFFGPGDFDAKPLPCSYSNQKYKVAALREFELKEEDGGGTKRVMICYTPNNLSLIWVEFDEAAESNEINW